MLAIDWRPFDVDGVGQFRPNVVVIVTNADEERPTEWLPLDNSDFSVRIQSHRPEVAQFIGTGVVHTADRRALAWLQRREPVVRDGVDCAGC